MACLITSTIPNISVLVDWIKAIPFEEWPQQHRLADDKLRPAMVTDRSWHGFGEIVSPIVEALHPLDKTYQWMLSAVMPGHSIPSHRDEQATYWLYRVHIPLLSNEKSLFFIEGVGHLLEVGHAYKVNTMKEHAVTNNGLTPRVHFMFDVRV